MNRLRKVSATLLTGLTLAAAVLLPATAAQAAQTDRFTFPSVDINVDLSKTDKGDSKIVVTETWVADFPPNQNHGMTRDLPKYWDGTTYHIGAEMLSITDENGKPYPYKETKGANSSTNYLIGSPYDYAEGRTTYVIKWEGTNVTNTYKDKKIDEFYWNLVPQSRVQEIQDVKVRINLDPSITKTAHLDSLSCYHGGNGSTDKCEMTAKDGVLSTVNVGSLNPYAGLTVAVAFDQGTFNPPKKTNMIAIIGGTFLGIFGMVGAGLVRGISVRRQQKKHRLTLTSVANQPVPQYTPPAYDIFESYELMKLAKEKTASNSTATAILEHSLRGYIQMQGDSNTPDNITLHRTTPNYDYRGGLSANDQQFQDTIFGRSTSISSKSVPAAASRLRISVKDELTGRGYTEKKKFSSNIPMIIGLMLIPAVPILALGIAAGSIPVAIFMALITASLSLLISLPKMKATVLTGRGVEAVNYLLGLRDYIQLAETERMRMLQSVQGAERPGNTIHLYERLLPYAALFGLEESWNKVIQEYSESHGIQSDYQQNNVPSYIFLNTMDQNFSSYQQALAASSGGSSGSSGGGSSGGGGGGGGAGGW